MILLTFIKLILNSKLLIAILSLSQVIISQSTSKNNEVVFDQNGYAKSIYNTAGNSVLNKSDASIPDNQPTSIIGLRALTELNVTGEADAYPCAYRNERTGPR